MAGREEEMELEIVLIPLKSFREVVYFLARLRGEASFREYLAQSQRLLAKWGVEITDVSKIKFIYVRIRRNSMTFYNGSL